jgi:hypothetical protein
MAYQQNNKTLPKLHQKTHYDQAYSPMDFNTSMTVDELDHFRKRLIANISELNLNKHRIRTNEFNQLTNYHHYALNILNNMQNIKRVEMSNPYNQNMRQVMGGQAQPGIETLNPYEGQMKVIYDSNGRTQLVTQDEFSQGYKEEWETQFDENILNPPSFQIPPSNCWNLPQKK